MFAERTGVCSIGTISYLRFGGYSKFASSLDVCFHSNNDRDGSMFATCQSAVIRGEDVLMRALPAFANRIDQTPCVAHKRAVGPDLMGRY